MFWFSHKENWEAGYALLFFIPHMRYFEEGVGLCPRAPTACLCLSLQGQQTLFLNAVIGNSIIQWNYSRTEFGLKHYYVALKMFFS